MNRRHRHSHHTYSRAYRELADLDKAFAEIKAREQREGSDPATGATGATGATSAVPPPDDPGPEAA
jgi:hypothetical protein